jgi:hypothetical protein
MKKQQKNWILFGGIALLLVAAVLLVNLARTDQTTSPRSNASAAQTPAHNHSHSPAQTAAAQRVPAYLQAPNRASLGPTLDPERFTGITRDAYRVAKQIPMTLAQLPCYCHCDEEFGHKSLYSCFQSEHAASCAVCVNEALLALTLERDQKLTPEQIRERIMQQYSTQ